MAPFGRRSHEFVVVRRSRLFEGRCLSGLTVLSVCDSNIHCLVMTNSHFGRLRISVGDDLVAATLLRRVEGLVSAPHCVAQVLTCLNLSETDRDGDPRRNQR